MGPISWPVDPGMLPTFVATMVLVEVAPGPTAAYLTAMSAAYGRRAGFLITAGATVGLGFYLLMTVAGFAAVAMTIPAVTTYVRWGGVALMLWMALNILRRGEAELPVTPRSSGGLVINGFLVALLSPIMLAFYLVVLPGFVRPGHGGLATQMLLLGLIHILVSIVVHGSVVLIAAAGAARLGVSRKRLVQRVCAAGLTGTAVWLAIGAIQ